MVTSTEGAGVGHLAQDDVASLNGDIEMIALADVEHAAGLGRDDDPAEVIDLASNPRVHGVGAYRSKPGECRVPSV